MVGSCRGVERVDVVGEVGCDGASPEFQRRGEFLPVDGEFAAEDAEGS
jgi:hypothetical protein